MTVDTRGLERAMATYARTKVKGDAQVVNKAMRFLLVNAASRIKKLTPGPSAIRAELTGGKIREKNADFKARTGGSATDNRHAYLRNTLAAAIVANRMRKRGRTFFPKSFGGNAKGSFVDGFYNKVQRFIAARSRSGNYLRAGFVPAFKEFGVPNRGPSSHKRFRGHSSGRLAVPSIRGIAEAYVVNAREGAYKIAPLTMHQAARDTRRQFLQWLKDDINATAKRSGFY